MNHPLRKVEDMATVQVAEARVPFPNWMVAAGFVFALSLVAATGNTIIQTSRIASEAKTSADGAVAVNADQQKKIDQLQSAFIELAAQRSDISSLQKQQDRMDAKLDRIIEAQSRNRR